MTRRLRRLVLYFLPLSGNLGLAVYLIWQLGLTPPYLRHGNFQMFLVLYAVGGLVMAVSGVTAFFHATTDHKGPRRWFALALVNTILPTLLLLVMMKFR
jgi:hypothetical protein